MERCKKLLGVVYRLDVVAWRAEVILRGR